MRAQLATGPKRRQVRHARLLLDLQWARPLDLVEIAAQSAAQMVSDSSRSADPPHGETDKGGDRKARLAQALRANLKRRKSQARRRQGTEPSKPEPGPAEGESRS